ncbi:MAG: hypothetical protein PHD51_04730 [Patescibacteria group bacterium]|nr:hypothetical protein [Patescibacteria group bacterium]MDD5043925.1 hypothetical protein [Patescibacteria group bacterium]MDD5490758.1 hypothetical protein [Patescibacteria group bacterium]
MLIINRFIPFFSCVLLFFTGEFLIFYPSSLPALAVLSIFFIFLSLWQLTGRRFKNTELWNFFIAPFLVFSGWMFFIIFLEEAWLKHALLIVTLIFIFVFLHSLFLFLHRTLSYRAYSLENVSGYFDLFAAWLWYSSFFGLIIFLGLPAGIFLLPVIIIGAAICYQNFWINKIAIGGGWLYLIIINLILAEIFLAVSFLPTTFYVNGLILTVGYFILSGVSKDSIAKRLDSRRLTYYFFIGGAALIICLATAKWL